MSQCADRSPLRDRAVSAPGDPPESLPAVSPEPSTVLEPRLCPLIPGPVATESTGLFLTLQSLPDPTGLPALECHTHCSVPGVPVMPSSASPSKPSGGPQTLCGGSPCVWSLLVTPIPTCPSRKQGGVLYLLPGAATSSLLVKGHLLSPSFSGHHPGAVTTSDTRGPWRLQPLPACPPSHWICSFSVTFEWVLSAKLPYVQPPGRACPQGVSKAWRL